MFSTSDQIYREFDLSDENKEIKPPFSNSKGSELVVVTVFKTDVMIVSQTCDVANDEQVTVARVRPFRHITNRPELQENIRCGNVMYAFYLPDCQSTNQESFSTLNVLTVLSKKLLNLHKSQRKKSLSPEGLRVFQLFIERFFGREAMPDVVSRIITEFSRELRNTDLKGNIERIYYNYSTSQISILVAISKDDKNAQAFVELAGNHAVNSIEHGYEVSTAYNLIDSILLRDIDGFREFR
jgi:hypothetical protein